MLPSTGGRADYSKLKLLAIYDPCMLKQSFWNRSFDESAAMNCRKLALSHLGPEQVEGLFGKKGKRGQVLDGGWCYDEWTMSSKTGGLADMGFSSHTAISIMDHMMEPGEFQTLVDASMGLKGSAEVRKLEKALQAKEVPDTLAKVIQEADVIAFCGGNPDLIAFVFRALPKVAGILRERVLKGEAVYLGRSAGGMVVGANAAFSSEPSPDMIEAVLDEAPEGLKLLPKCIIKPHFKMAAHEAYAEALEQLTGQHVVRMPNGVALACQSGACKLVGQAMNIADTSFGDQAGMAHLASLFKAAGSHTHPEADVRNRSLQTSLRRVDVSLAVSARSASVGA